MKKYKTSRKDVKSKNYMEYKNEKYLLIVESPSKCKKIEEYLGSEYKCVASNGHITKLKSYNNFVPIYENIEDKKKHINDLTKLISNFKVENIYLATDMDREGETIAYFCANLIPNVNINTIKRITFNEITKTALQYAVQNPTTINMNLVNSQKARQILDVLIGYKISPFLWRFSSNEKGNYLSAGRCQTPALRLIYDNYLKEKECVLKKLFKTTGFFFERNIEFKLNKDFINESDVNEFIDLSSSHKYIVTLCSPKVITKSSPKPYNTAKLLQEATHILSASPKDIMSYCQALYQDGLITYMRTDSMKYANDFLQKAKDKINDKYGEDYVGNISELENKNSKDPHEAIRVTSLDNENINHDGKIKRLYNMIYINTISSCMSSAKYEKIECCIDAPKSTYYSNIIEKPIFLGWKKSTNSNESNVLKDTNIILYLKMMSESKSKVNCNKIKSEESIAQKHSHYTESALIKKMEELEIGRPSTYALFLDTIQTRGYVKKINIEEKLYNAISFIWSLQDGVKKENIEKKTEKELNRLIIQPIGIIAIEFLIRYFDDFFSYTYTKHMECELDKILNGSLKEWKEVCIECDNNINKLSHPLRTIIKDSYVIDKQTQLSFYKNGPVLITKNSEGENVYVNVKKELEIDIDKLKNGSYTRSDLEEINSKLLGRYNETDLYIKIGKYGLYAEWGESRKSLSSLNKKIDDITIDEVIPYLNKKKSNNINILREFTDEISVRKGKYGPYVYYKTSNMMKPDFLSLQTFKEGFSYCKESVFFEWLEKTHNVKI